MKQIGLLLCLLFGFYACNESNKQEWELIWEDDFDSAVLDSTVWSKIPRGNPPWQKYMSDHDSCYAIRDGNLILRGIKNTYFPNDTAAYLTGGVYTKGKLGFSEGKVEIKAKLFGAQGAWPAIWMLPQKGNWPNGGEIDIMERLNFDSIAYQTIHTHYTFDLGITDPKNGSTGKIDPDNYNTYSVEIYEDSLSFYINDLHTFTYPRIDVDKKQEQFPFDNPFYLLMDMQLGGGWVGPINADHIPVEMHIDWVRFYKKD